MNTAGVIHGCREASLSPEEFSLSPMYTPLAYNVCEIARVPEWPRPITVTVDTYRLQSSFKNSQVCQADA